MVQSAFRIQAVIPATSGIVADSVVNTFGAMADTDLNWWPKWVADMKLFYDSWATFRAQNIAWPQARLKLYDLNTPKPRAPLRDDPMVLNATVANSVAPRELAVCCSFQGTRISGLPQARRRGRVYFGPFGTNANLDTTGKVNPSLASLIRTGAEEFLNRHNTGNATGVESNWSVISGADTATPQAVLIVDGWVDNAWDVQRRRGLRPDTRVLFTDVPP